MVIKPDTPLDAFREAMDRSVEIIKEEILTQLKRLGEESVTRIRRDHPGNWMDRTGNLRSSIGYAVFDYGKNLMESAFDSVGSGSEGSQKGKAYIESLAGEYAKVYALVVVAGMNYAEYVETKRDVLESTKLWAEQEVNGRVKDAMDIAEKRITRLFKKL